MNISTQLFAFTLFRYLTSADDSLEYERRVNTRASSLYPAMFDEMNERRATPNSKQRNMSNNILNIDNITTKTNIIEEEHITKSNNITNDTVRTSWWKAAFSIGEERKIRRLCAKDKLAKCFVTRLGVIINELYNEMHRSIQSVSDDEFYSIEMLNNISFLKETYLDYFAKFRNIIVDLVGEYMIVHYLKASKLSDIKIGNKIKKIIAIIRKLDAELRKLILPYYNSFNILNNVVDGMPYIGNTKTYIDLISTPKFLSNRNTIKKIHAVGNTWTIRREQPYFLSIKFVEAVNMIELYKNLEILKKNTKLGDYYDSKCYCIAYLYLLEFSFLLIRVGGKYIPSIATHSAHVEYLSLIKSGKDCRLTSFLIGLLPTDFIDILMQQPLECLRPLVKICFEKIIKIVDFRAHLLEGNLHDRFIDFSHLNPTEKFKCIEAIIACYNAYIGFICAKYETDDKIITNDLEALAEIIRIIEKNLETTDANISAKNNDKYVVLYWALKKLTSKTIECNSSNNSPAFSDYPHLLEFYSEYHKTYLKIDCIYNIGFLLGQSPKGTELRLYRDKSSNVDTDNFYSDVDLFIQHLRNIEYKIDTYDSEIYNILDHIMKCLVERNQGNYSSKLLEYNQNPDLEPNKSDIKFHLNVIEYTFWPKLPIYTDIITTHGEYGFTHSIMTLYESKYVSETYINRLYDVFVRFLGPCEERYAASLRSLVVNSENKKIMDELLTDIMFEIFGFIKRAYCVCNDVIEGLRSAQALFRCFKRSYRIEIVRRVVSEFFSDRNYEIRSEMPQIVKDLGIYVLFDDIIFQYSIIFRDRTRVNNFVTNCENISQVKKCGYEVLLTCYDSLTLKILKSLEKPDSLLLQTFSIQSSITMIAIGNTDNDFIIASQLLKFILKINSIASMIDNIALVIEKLNICLQTIVSHCDRNKVLEDNFSCCKVLFCMVSLVLQKIEEITMNNLSYFFNSMCVAFIQISREDTSETIIMNYYDLEEIFLDVIDDLDIKTRWETLFSLLCYITNDETKYDKYKNFGKVINILKMLLGRNLNINNDHSIFIDGSYIVLEKLLLTIGGNTENSSDRDCPLLDEICSLVGKDDKLLRSLGYKKVTKYTVEDKNNTYDANVGETVIITLNCDCKPHEYNIICSLKSELSKINSQNFSEFKAICCVCKK